MDMCPRMDRTEDTLWAIIDSPHSWGRRPTCSSETNSTFFTLGQGDVRLTTGLQLSADPARRVILRRT
jgi:hypothetical protein